MRTIDFRGLSKRLAQAATEIRHRRQSLMQATSLRLRELRHNRDWSIMRRRRDDALEIYVAQAHASTGHEVADHIANVVHKRLMRLSQTKNFETDKDPVEALHDFRVASRRLRAFVDVFEPLLDPATVRRAKRPLRKITRTVRGMRDCDVQMGLLRERHGRAASDIERIALEDLIATTTALRKREARLLRRRMRRLDLGEVNFALCAILGMTVTRLPPPGSQTSHLSLELLEPFTQPGLAQRPPDDGLEHADHLHQLRIRLKKLRYALELFEPALGTAFEQLYAPVESLQELLGHHHDLVVLTEVIANRRHHLERDNRSTLAQALGTFEQRLIDERQVLVAQYRDQGFDLESWRRTLRGQLEPDASQWLVQGPGGAI